MGTTFTLNGEPVTAQKFIEATNAAYDEIVAQLAAAHAREDALCDALDATTIELLRTSEEMNSDDWTYNRVLISNSREAKAARK